MSWSLKGSDVETCSCELMCPCNLSFDHGATYDFCRATLVFSIRVGEIDGREVFGGQLGGPMAGIAPLVGEMAGVERAAIEVHDDGLRHSVRVGDAIDFEVEDIVPFGVETGEPVRFAGMFHPAGSNLTMAEATRSRINAFGIEYEGKTGLSTAEFSWAA
jgi:hypothetical protein